MAATHEFSTDTSSVLSFADCESAYTLIKAGREKEAERQFPLEYYLIQKYSYADMNHLAALLEMKLTVNG